MLYPCCSFDQVRCTVGQKKLSINNIFLNEKFIDDDYLDIKYILDYQKQFLDSIDNIIESIDNQNLRFFCRAARALCEFHSLSNRGRRNAQNFVISFYDDNNRKHYGEVIFFYILFGTSYPFPNMYDTVPNCFSRSEFIKNGSLLSTVS